MNLFEQTPNGGGGGRSEGSTQCLFTRSDNPFCLSENQPPQPHKP